MLQTTADALVKENNRKLDLLVSTKDKQYISQDQPDEEGNYIQTWKVKGETLSVVLNIFN